MPEGVPLQSLSHPSGWPTVWRSAPAPKVPSPFDDITRSGPVCGRPSGSDTVPTPGFLTPSPVSWLRSSLRVCFAPQPSLGFCSLQSVPLASGRAPLVGAAGSLAVLPGRTPVRRPRSCRPRPSPTRATFGRRPWPDPVGARGSLSAPLPALPCGTTARGTSRSPWTSYAGLTSVRPFRRLRSVLPCASPFTPRVGPPHLRDGLVRAEAGALLGVPRPSRALLPPDLGPSFTRHGRRRPSSRWQRAPLGASRDSGDPPASVHAPGLRPECCGAGDPRSRVESCVDDRNVPHDPSAVTGLFEPGPCRLSAATSTPMTFDEAMRMAPPHVLERST